MLKTIGFGRVTTNFDLVKLNLDGEDHFKVEIPLACDTGRSGNKTAFVQVVLWDARAKAAAEYLLIGQQVHFCGDLEIQDYTIRNGEHAGHPGRAVKISNVSEFTFGQRPQNPKKGPACPALFKGTSTGAATVVTSLSEVADTEVVSATPEAPETVPAEAAPLDTVDGEEDPF
jgi:single-stranded DNA-binding protein